MARLFGTDGIRGVANEDLLTPELAFRVGRQFVATLQATPGAERVRVVIGRDTRLSGPLLDSAMVAGLLSAGAECFAVGVLPTPGIAHITRALGAHGGIVLSASHNAFEDNGIKLFSAEARSWPTRRRARSSRRWPGRTWRPGPTAPRSAGSSPTTARRRRTRTSSAAAFRSTSAG